MLGEAFNYLYGKIGIKVWIYGAKFMVKEIFL
jgi:ribosomal protein S3